MRTRAAAVAAVLLTALVGVAPGAPAATPRPVPPPAPSPTDSGNSPAAPDPHPPLGGRDATGAPVGGASLLARGDVLPRGAAAPPSAVTARSWIVVDLDSGAVLAARDPHGRYQPASIQKLLTAVTLLPLLPGGRQVTVTRAAADTEGSHAGLQAGHRYTVDQLFAGLLLVSGNDCAEALAAAAGGRARTVALMNATARTLGAYDTFVQTPSGLDGWQQLTSAYDMALFLRAALAQPRFVAYDRAATAQLPGTGTLENQNELFLAGVRGALVAKTGFTDAAQHTFVGAVRRGGHRYGVVLMRAQRWPLDQWQQAMKLVSWVRALPAGTAPVGTLDSPQPPPVRAVVAKPSSGATAQTRRAHPPGAVAATAVRGGVPLPLQLALAGLVVAAAALFARRHLVRR